MHSSAAAAEPAPDWKDWAAITGAWDADPGPGAAAGGYALNPELDGRVLVRRSHADRPGAKHEHLTIVYRDGATTRAEYWDNEGHVIRYTVTVEKGKSYTFLSDAVPGQPRFRLTYLVKDARSVTIRFEVAPPGTPEQWKKYIEAGVHRAG